MRILQFCSKPPLPAIDGGCLASYELSVNLMELGHDVSILTLSTEKHPFIIDDQNRDFYLKSHAAGIKISTQKSVFFYIKNLFSAKSLQEHRFFDRNALILIEKYLKKNQFDLIIYDGLMAGIYFSEISKISGIKSIYRSHNIEYQLLKERSGEYSNPFKALIFSRESKKLRSLESNLWTSVSQVWTISRDDTNFITSKTKSEVRYIPFSTKVGEVKTSPKANTFFHLGSMDWSPNFIGINSFIKNCWSAFAKKNDFELHLGGKGISSVKHKIQGKGIVIHENVMNAEEFFSRYEIMLIPIKSGSGIRVKAIQALAMGKIIISTEKGIAGIPAENGKNMMICKSDDEMLQAMEEVVSNTALKESMKSEGRSLFDKEFSRTITKEKISSALSEI